MGSQPSLLASRCRHGALLLLALAILGCHSRATATVTGRVTYRGQPLTTGQVTFVYVDGQMASARIKSDGTYTIYRAPVGRVRILVASKPRFTPLAKGPGGGEADPNPLGADESETAATLLPLGPSEPIPEHYSRPDPSNPVYGVRRGEQTYDIVLVP